MYLTADLKAWAQDKIDGVSGELGTIAGGCEPRGFGGSRLWFEKEGACLLRKKLHKSGPTAWILASPFEMV